MKKISLFGAVSTGVGMLIATSCFVSSASGSSAVGTPFVIAIVIACIANMLAVLSIAELNAIMPNLTGGIAQYTLAGLGPLLTIVTMIGGYDDRRLFNKQCFRRTCRRCDVCKCNDGNDG